MRHAALSAFSIQHFLPSTSPEDWGFLLRQPCPRQGPDDCFNCGVFCVAAGFYLSVGAPLPDSISPEMWRAFLSTMLGRDKLYKTLPLHLRIMGKYLPPLETSFPASGSVTQLSDY